MDSTNNRSEQAAELRKLAEDIAQKSAARLPETISPEEVRRIFHELSVHQIELEMQNEELRRSQAELDAGRVRYSDLYNQAPVGYCTINEQGLILEANFTAAALFGLPLNSMFKQPVSRFILGDDQDIYYLFHKQLVKSGEAKTCELRMVKMDGTAFWGQMVAAIAQDTDGTKVCRTVLSDISERKQAEVELRNSETHLRTLMQTIPDLIWLKNTEGVYLTCNTMFERFFGAREADIVGKTDYDFVDRELADSFREHDRKAMAAGEPASNEEWITFADDGRRAYLETIKTPMHDSRGTLIGVLGIGRDITERKQAEEALLALSTRHEATLAAVPEIIMEVDCNKVYTWANQGGIEFFGEDVIGRNAAFYFEGEQQVYDAIQPLFNGDEHVIYVESWQRRKDGEKRLLAWWCRMLKDVNGHVTGALSTARDITALKQTEEALQSKTALLEAQMNASLDGILVVDENQKVILVNRRFAELLNVPQNILPTPRHVLYNGDDAALLEHVASLTRYPAQFIEKVMYLYDHVDETSHDEVEFKSGMVLDRYSAPVLDKDGKYYGRIWTFSDITERKRTEDILTASETSYRRLFESAKDGILILDAETGKITNVNPFLIEMLGYSKEQFIEKEIWEIGFFKDIVANQDKFLELQQKEYVRYEDLPLETSDGRKMNVEFVSNVYPVNNHKVIQCNIRDITQRKLAEKELIKAKEKAEESDRLKSAFLTNMSHEIRTPMNGILGFTELLKEPHLTGEEQQTYISIIEQSGVRMLNTINDIISISKIESGQMDVSISATNINEQIEYIYNFFKPEIEQKGMQISFKNTLPAKEAVIKTDREKIYGILTNLVKNAIKFTFAGSIEFGYEKKGGFLEFFVKDTGIGIAKDRQNAVFERFIRINIDDNRAFQGSGLGLSISKAYVEMLGGGIRMESEEGKGSVFYFTIPYNPAQEEKNVIKNIVSSDEKDDQIKPLKILIAEDDERSEMLITIIVNKFSREVLKARTGVEAVAACRNNPDLDLVLLDIAMPEMNGYEAARQIRQFNKDVVIIAQTAFALSGEREKIIAAGCNDYISKPFSKTSLTALLKKHF
ncbi:MAG: PAS domain S-box protein [Victivallaceae bacterium]|jgi:PAS domain S-box-containing protein